MKINGTLINYYFHCKRQCWLHGSRINMEDNSEDVHIGKITHELKSEGKKNAEISIDNVKIDKITKDYLVEIKKSDADVEAVKWQVLFYLSLLKGKGINREGKIEFQEKNKQDKKIIYVSLTEENEMKLKELSSNMEKLFEEDMPPKVKKVKGCRKCAYYEYCYI
ncbi:MAG: CRISPR-associated protein Cas4 [Clostridium sp.]|jgi:CRISPR-associated exonuclease Cas4|uniref:CRISPR-associated protein Cas4 n=1 Tax=Clostridium sp. TaxID=1506 RepID=UPI0025BF7FDA|nr:CRISPR-associated protein Cas4 [Clostridium sp.]MCH3963144.1 CRISPR-associated protein Cas4 [Clostridium sp.]MCI1716393.1 CRISPR-associated protein Cas4 [Clostridium sp.]MCI1800733.1 CRISPR-associated protein Cas4 [Clostridium sp.]MCI1814612.1 CRISPR-associated protein Cas4 [Clostridium sp.]MCI1871522.1 CRISPR-associated protein Cas4 [Clostridium sp.]